MAVSTWKMPNLHIYISAVPPASLVNCVYAPHWLVQKLFFNDLICRSI